MKHQDSKEKRNNVIAFKIKRAISLDTLSFYKPNANIRERFYRPPYGRIGERGECYGER